MGDPPVRPLPDVVVLEPDPAMRDDGGGSRPIGTRRAAATRERQRARALRAEVLSEITGTPLPELSFTVDPGGRPRLTTCPTVDFSLSHSGGAVALAIASGQRIGVDLEVLRPVRGGLEARRRCFSPSERARILHAEDADAELLRIWTRKEALLKATGIGLRVPLDEVLGPDVDDQGDALVLKSRREVDPLRRWWSILTFEPFPGYVGACAISGTGLGGPRPRVSIRSAHHPTSTWVANLPTGAIG